MARRKTHTQDSPADHYHRMSEIGDGIFLWVAPKIDTVASVNAMFDRYEEIVASKPDPDMPVSLIVDTRGLEVLASGPALEVIVRRFESVRDRLRTVNFIASTNIVLQYFLKRLLFRILNTHCRFFTDYESAYRATVSNPENEIGYWENIKRDIRQGKSRIIYGIAGACFGICFPLGASFYLYLTEGWNLWESQIYGGGLMWMIDTAPLFLGIFAAFGGSKQDQLRRQHQSLQSLYDQQNMFLTQSQSDAKIGSWYMTLPERKLSHTATIFDLMGVPRGKHLEFEDVIEFFHPEYRDKLHECVQSILDGENQFDEQFRFINKYGKEFWVRCIGTAVYENDKLIAIRGSMQDIDNIKEVEEQLGHSARLASIGQMAAGVGHEVNNPLTIAMGFLGRIEKNLKNGATDRERLKSSFEKIHDAHIRIKKIVDGLRLYSRFKENNQQEVNIYSCVQSTHSMLHDLLSKEGVELLFETNIEESKSPFVLASPSKLQQILVNLINNARDATLSNESQKSIRLSLERDPSENQVVLSVSDNGQGIPKEIQGKIFDAFYTTKDTNNGTGLGLGLVQKIVKDFDGEISFTSQVGEGTVFTVILPSFEAEILDIVESEGVTEINQVLVAGPSEHLERNFNILVVDDEEDIRELLVDVLTDFGVENVKTANGGKEALECMRNESFDLVITDMKMPEMSGKELISTAKADPAIRSTPIAVLTGGVEEDMFEHVDRSWRENTIQVLSKPYRKDELESLLDRLDKPSTST